MVRFVSLFATILMLPLPSMADLLFEGWSKIKSGGVHVGYTVGRYEFDPKKKQFVSTYLIKTGSLGSDITESLNAVADNDLKPISYQYTSIVGKKSKTIDAKFLKNKMTATVTEQDLSNPKSKPSTKTISKDLPKGSFLSTFLVYLLLKSKTGLKTEEKYSYQAIAEEDAELTKGEAFVGKEEMKNDVRAFRILNRFKGEKFVSYVTDRGEVIMTESPASGISTELMAKPADATAEFGTSSSILKNLFGEVPKGTDNIVSKSALEKSLRPPPESGKKEGVPQGTGIVVKPGAEGK